jgi:exonuclease VII large subunit
MNTNFSPKELTEAVRDIFSGTLGYEIKEKISSEIMETLEERLSELMEKKLRLNEERLKELTLLERIIRVEEELKALRELEGKRFESLMREMNARFEAMNVRFESLEKRMNFMQWLITAGFAFLGVLLARLKFL